MDILLYSISKCLPCFPDLSSPSIAINGTKYKIIRLLGEGGFSYVYLVAKGSSNNSLYALKKIRCPFGGDESFKMALKEIRNYHRFTASKTPYIVQSIDESVIDESDGSKTIYILLPYFEHSLQDIINSNVLNGTSMREEEVLRIFVGVSRGLQAMHKYKVYGASSNNNIEDEEDDLLLPQSLTGEDDNVDTAPEMGEMSELSPFAHRDLKPANVMLSSTDGLPVLVDLGSCSKARIQVRTRQQALTLTDFAQEHCTLPYRAPELLDVSTGAEINESTDIWSLGCLLYACMYGYSPFEKLELEEGANLNIAISQGKYNIPAPNATAGIGEYSDDLKGIIKKCLQLKSEDRPTIDQVLQEALEIQRK